ncbi:MAG TPA: hypothetical protein VJ506_03040 [Candidatus Limnocylindrales bacterium]|nr:hypothetical protein [Candidatus Limnocylindrales bacterium]
MSRREAWLSAGLVFLVALAVRAWAATLVSFPRPEDAAYYVDVARNLVTGQGLTSDAIWSYGTPPFAFPRPAFEVWLPLATFLDAIPIAIAGGPLGAFRAAQIASILVGSAVPVLGWRLAADVADSRGLGPRRARWIALGTGLAAAVYLPLVLFSVQPDSTLPFAALVLAAVLVIPRVLRLVAIAEVPPAPPRLRFSRRKAGRGSTAPAAPAVAPLAPSPLRLDRPLVRALVGLGVVLGIAALARNEAIWLALAWAFLAWRATGPAGGFRRRVRAALPLIGIPAVVSIAVYAPWALRDWSVFGNPLPGQALSNALFLNGRDVFAWAEPPTLDRYLGAGIGTLVGLRITGFLHNLGSVLLFLGVPISALGLLALPWTARGRVLAPLVTYSVIAFLVATLVFPVATTWGTFLHAAGAIHVLILISALLALDVVIDRLRRLRAWTRPVSWLGATLAVVASLLMTLVLLPGDASLGDDLAQRYAELPAALATAGAPLPTDGTPVITDFPIWLATETGTRAIALPDEVPADVLDLASRFNAKLLIVDANDEGQWPEILDQEEPGSECFQLVPLQVSDIGPLGSVVVFRITCYSPAVQGTP